MGATTQLPELANIFRITIDELFGLSLEKETVYSFIGELPWHDDELVRIALYDGKKLMNQSDYVCNDGINVINFDFRGDHNVNGVCKFVFSKSNK